MFEGHIFRCSSTDLKYLNVLGWMVVVFIFVLGANRYLHPGEQRDFVYFYSVGHILNDHAADRLYDFSLQRETFQSILPAEGGQYGPSPYPPFVALVFEPFARFPYWTACRIWLAVSLGVYFTGLWILIRRFCAPDPWERSLVLCFALTYWPMVSWVLLGGQLSAVGFTAMALAMYWEESGRRFASGLALSLCIYKPTLLLLVVPMLVVLGLMQTLAGLASGLLGLFAVTSFALGPGVWTKYFSACATFAGQFDRLPAYNYVDLRGLPTALSGGVGRVVFDCALAAVVFGLAVRFWSKARGDARISPTTRIWACTLAWTPLLNVYFPIYDSVLVIASLIVCGPDLSRVFPRVSLLAMAALLVCSFATVQIAKATGYQILTPVLIVIGVLQLRVLLVTVCKVARAAT